METPKYYFPPSPAEYPGWIENFYKVLDANKVLLGIIAAILARLLKFHLGLAYYGKCLTIFEEFLTKCYGNRNIMIYGDAKNPELDLTEYELVPTGPAVPEDQVEPNEHLWIVSIVTSLRSNPNMSTTLATALGMDPRPVSKYDTDVPPVLKGKVINGQAELNCPLKNFKGYEIWRRDTPDGAFFKIGASISRFYIDTDELPEGVNTAQRTYIVRMLGVGNVPVGLPSNEVTLVVFRAAVPS